MRESRYAEIIVTQIKLKRLKGTYVPHDRYTDYGYVNLIKLSCWKSYNFKLINKSLNSDHYRLVKLFKHNINNIIVVKDLFQNAINNSDFNMATFLLNYDVRIQDIRLDHVVTKGCYRIIELLLQHGLKPGELCHYITGMIVRNHLKIFRLLKNRGVTTIDNVYQRLLNCLCLGELQFFKDILKCKPSINTYTATELLKHACIRGRTEMAKCIINVDVIHNYEPSLILCCQNNRLDIIQILIDNKVNVNYDNHRPLMLACQRNNYNMAKLLIDNGALITDDHIDAASANSNCNILDLFNTYLS
jgi:hypothetical protein